MTMTDVFLGFVAVLFGGFMIFLIHMANVDIDSRRARLENLTRSYPECIYLEQSSLAPNKAFFVCKDGNIHLYGEKK